jgi:hypothetical protein
MPKEHPEDYAFNISNQRDTVKAVAESAMREVIGRGEILPILTIERPKIESSVQEIMQNVLNGYAENAWLKSPKCSLADRSGYGVFQAIKPGAAYALLPSRIRARYGPNGRRRLQLHKCFVGMRGAPHPAHRRFALHRKAG